MTVVDTVLCNDPEVKRLALEALEECTDLQAFGRRCLEILLNSLVSAKANEACGAPYGERSPERTNSRNGYRERGLLTSAGDIRVGIPKLKTGTFFPRGPHRALLPGGPCARGRGGRDVRHGHLRAQDGGGGGRSAVSASTA